MSSHNAFVALVLREEIVAKRPDWIVEHHRQMGDRFLSVVQQRQ
jgi:hypothetical protein